MKLTANTFLTLDGVMQGPGLPDEDRSGGFEHGGWQVPYADEDLNRIVSGHFAAADAFLLGRKTYEIFASYWPTATGEYDLIANKLNTLPKYVASTTLGKVEWDNSTLIQGDVAEAVAELKRQPGNELQVHGSGGLIQTLLAHDLVDEYRLWIYPVVLGAGRRLFTEGSRPTALRLVDSLVSAAGAQVNTYVPAGRPTYGSFA